MYWHCNSWTIIAILSDKKYQYWHCTATEVLGGALVRDIGPQYFLAFIGRLPILSQYWIHQLSNSVSLFTSKIQKFKHSNIQIFHEKQTIDTVVTYRIQVVHNYTPNPNCASYSDITIYGAEVTLRPCTH